MSNIINLYRCENKIVNDAFDNIVANICLQKEKNGYKSFMLTGCEAGVGTTTITVELAISLSMAGWKTVLLDCDMRKVSAYKRLNEDLTKGLTDYVKSTATINDIICDTNWTLLDYIPCGSVEDENPLRMLYSQNLTKLMSQLTEEYDYIILDVPSVNSSVDSHILSVKCDATLLVASLDGNSKQYLENSRDLLVKDGANLIGVIGNMVSLDQYKHYVKDYDYFNEKKYARRNRGKKD